MLEFKENDFIVKLQFNAIEVINFQIKVPMENLSNLDKFNFTVDTELQINEENKLLVIVVEIKIYDSTKTIEIGNFKTNNVFLVIENFDLIKAKLGKEHIPMPQELVTMLNSISLSTTRGVMWSTFKGTILHNAVLPLWNPKFEIAK